MIYENAWIKKFKQYEYIHVHVEKHRVGIMNGKQKSKWQIYNMNKIHVQKKQVFSMNIINKKQTIKWWQHELKGQTMNEDSMKHNMKFVWLWERLDLMIYMYVCTFRNILSFSLWFKFFFTKQKKNCVKWEVVSGY